MKEFLLFIIWVFISSSLSGQQLESITLNSSGGVSPMMSFSVGEFAVQSHLTNNLYLTEGLLQGEFNIVHNQESQSFLKDVHIYPNPVVQELHIEKKSNETYFYRMYTAEGRLVDQRTSNQPLTKIDMSTKTHGTYILHISTENQNFIPFTIIKS